MNQYEGVHYNLIPVRRRQGEHRAQKGGYHPRFIRAKHHITGDKQIG